MKPTNEELEKLRLYAMLTHTEDKYVWLREDEKGTYIEYAFKEGAPHDNRCIAWYWSLQPNAMRRNGEAFGDTDEAISQSIDRRRKQIEECIGHLYRLWSNTCGFEENLELRLSESERSWKALHYDEPFEPQKHICRVGCPAQKCRKNDTCAHWTYEEPVKCACWNLEKVDKIPTSVSISIDDAMRLKNELLKNI